MPGFRPMKGWNKSFDLNKVRYPILGSLKLDGLRALWAGKEFLSSALKTLPNRNVQRMFVQLNIPAMWDGELVDGDPGSEGTYHRSESTIMSLDKDASGVRFFVFDNPDASGGFAARNNTLTSLFDSQQVMRVVKLRQTILGNAQEVKTFYEQALEDGYEGVILRSMGGAYKYGRSTFNEGYMLKLKPMEDAEAPIIRFEELMRNFNEAETNNLGLTQRSSSKEGKVPGGTLGKVIVDWHGQELKIGCFKGITKAQLHQIWLEQEKHIGRLVKFRYFSYGIKELPRQARMTGFRDPITL